mgnify:CR=1 FL=1
MNLSNLQDVNELVNIERKCIAQLSNIDEYIMKAREHEDSGSVEGFKKGYWASFSEHTDGSGTGADLSGCYIGIEVAQSIHEHLCAQIARIENRLMDLGVEIESPFFEEPLTS